MPEIKKYQKFIEALVEEMGLEYTITLLEDACNNEARKIESGRMKLKEPEYHQRINEARDRWHFIRDMLATTREQIKPIIP